MKLIRDSVIRSFPACRRQSVEGAATPPVLIEIHRFAASNGEVYRNSAAERTVLARHSEGETMTELQELDS